LRQIADLQAAAASLVPVDASNSKDVVESKEKGAVSGEE
jgi:hypothetical protein